LLAVRILAAGDPTLTGAMLAYQQRLRESAEAKGERVRQQTSRD
jgi:5-(carboxyamino)imidazole ribonucleotide mutase